MNIRNVTITGPDAGFQLPSNCPVGNNFVLYGIWFDHATGGSVSNVTVQHIFQFQNGAFGSCQTGRAIRADNSGTITITHTTVTDYQKSGFEARGSTTMNVSDSTAGPAHPLEGLIAQNGVSIVGAAGTVANNTIFGSGDLEAGVGGSTAGTAVLLFGAHDVTVTHNTLTSPAAPRPGTDLGISVAAGSSTGIVISFNKINRLGPDVPDTFGHGIDVDTTMGSTATLTCNTFSNWNINVVGAEQIACTPLPDGNECQAYSAPAPAVDSGKNYSPLDPNPIIDATPFDWTIDSGTLPPGLSLSSGGAITGTPTATGTFPFTMKLVDMTGLTATQAQTITIASDCGPPDVIDKVPDSPTVTAGGLAGYRITVSNRGRVAARNWWVCDRMPRGMTFVRATRHLRRLRRLRCLVIPRLRPHHHISFHVTARVASNAPTGSTLTNIAVVIPGPPPATPGTPAAVPPLAQLPIAADGAKQKVLHPATRPPAPAPPPVTG
jgi:uncharacterized repeat protein (TIGR01451 family)